MLTAAAALLIAYLLGAVPFGYVLVKLTTGRDVRAAGSGNIGATNVLRTTSRSLGFLTLALDIAKGAAAVWIADALTNSVLWTSAAAVAVMLGHIFPVFLKFQGGKAVASYLGAFLYLAPAALGCVLLVFVLIVWRTKYISLGSIVGAAALPVLVLLLPGSAEEVVAAAALGGVLIIWRHHENIARLRAGRENKLSLGSQRA